MTTPVQHVEYKGLDISFDPNEDNTVLTSVLESSARRREPVDLVWSDLSFTVPIKATRSDKKTPLQRNKQILNNISGHIRAGSMLAVMGSSGAGKTSLLNLLAGRINSSKGAKATGQVFVNGEPRDYNKFTKLAAYVLQDDDMFGELTVEEQLTYAALLRLPASMQKERKMIRVQKVIRELGLGKIRKSMIGNQIVRGISGGERKRVNIGTELVTDPALLFLDEPTTGLDSFNALNVMTSLRHLASNGRTVISTIHQPRSSIYALFDQLCLLSEGRVMYFGPAKDAMGYFAGIRFNSPAQFNPADFFLDLLSVDPRSADLELDTQARIEYLGDKFAEQADPVSIRGYDHTDIEANEEEEEEDEAKVQLKDSKYQTSWFNEFSVLLSRAFKLASRERISNIVRFGQTLVFSVLLGLIWLRNGASDDGAKRGSLVGVIFFMIINQAFSAVFSVIFGFPLERSVVNRERASNMYRTSSYYLAKAVTDLPKTLMFNLIFTTIIYFMVGFKETAGGYFIFLVFILLISTIAESLAISVSILTGDVQTAAGILPVFIILAVLFGGFFIGETALPEWIDWGKYLSFVFYAFKGMVRNEFGDFDDSSPYSGSIPVAGCIGALIGFAVVFRFMGYLFLAKLRGPRFLKF